MSDQKTDKLQRQTRSFPPAKTPSPPEAERQTSAQPVAQAATTLMTPEAGAPQRAEASANLQQSIGNARVGELVERDVSPKHTPVQPRLAVSDPGNDQEQEAEQVADRVTHNSANSEHPAIPPIQRRSMVPGRNIPLTTQTQATIKHMRGGGQQLPKTTRAEMEQKLGYDLGDVHYHTDERAANAAREMNAQAFTTGRDIAFASGKYAPDTAEGNHLLAHELTHVVQQAGSGTDKPVQRRIQPEDVSAEMIGRQFSVSGPFTAGAIRLTGGELVIVVGWSNTASTAQVRLPTSRPETHFDIPKRLLRATAPGTPGIAPYSADVAQQAATVERGEQQLDSERARRGGPRPGEISRLEGLQRNREQLLNRRLIQETMFNRFDPMIRHWTDHYNRQFGYTGVRALDPNLVKSMLFQESQMGTAGEHLEEPPTHRVKTRFNLAQVVDSSAAALLIMMREMQQSLIASYHLQNINADLSAAQAELRTLRAVRRPTAAQAARLAELTHLSEQSWETFLWAYRAPGQRRGFSDAVHEFFTSVSRGVPARNMDYNFWIQAAVRWLFEKRGSVRSWEEAVRAYNGGGARATRYRNRVRNRARAATAAQQAGQVFIPSNI